jgi:hypothetical protein
VEPKGKALGAIDKCSPGEAPFLRAIDERCSIWPSAGGLISA